MRAWQTVLVVNISLLIGLGAGYLHWGRQVQRLTRDLVVARQNARPAPREWHTSGVVRAVFPDLGVVVLSHGEMPGYMRAMTMGFRVASPSLYQGLEVGDEVTFTVRGVVPRIMISAMEKIAPHRVPAR